MSSIQYAHIKSSYQVYTLLQLFEEFDIYTKPSGSQSLENNAILKSVLPQNVESFSKLQFTAEKKYI
jgi:hypothetical protein